MICARRILIPGLDNMRDLGGFITEDGKITRYGTFLRSESMFGLDESVIPLLKKHGITGCIDMHGEVDELEKRHPLRDNAEFEYYCIPKLSSIIRHEGTERDGFKEEYWITVNIDMLETNKDWIRDVIKACANSKMGTVIHCRTGKTRTSLICMMIMMLVRVPTIDIIAEYSTVEIYMRDKYKRLLESSFHSEGFYKSSPFIIEETIKYILDNYGTIESYLESCGVTAADMSAIACKLVTEM